MVLWHWRFFLQFDPFSAGSGQKRVAVVTTAAVAAVVN